MSAIKWIYGGANVIGTSHIETNTPCQDAFSISTSKNEEWVAVAICDGAGSAKHSEKGAHLVASTFSKKLIDLSNEFDNNRLPGAWVNDYIIQQIIDIRRELRKASGKDDISEFHTTLVACLLGKTGGFVIHIGDGSLVGGKSKLKENVVILDEQFFISEPRNGEYANETFFITEGDWIKHLRFNPLPPLDWFFIGTDGGNSFYLNTNNTPKKEFITSLLKELHEHPHTNWNTKMESVLKDERAKVITNDDKTLFVFSRLELQPSLELQFDEKGDVKESVDNSTSNDLNQFVLKKKLIKCIFKNYKFILFSFLILIILTISMILFIKPSLTVYKFWR